MHAKQHQTVVKINSQQEDDHSRSDKSLEHYSTKYSEDPLEAFLWISGSVFAVAVREESLLKETQWDQIRLMTRQKESMTNF